MAKINPCFKRTFVFFNILFAILGIVVLCLGWWIHGRVTESDQWHAAILLEAAGVVIFILSFLGAYGAYKENKCILITFFVCMCVGTIAFLRLAIPLAMSRSEVKLIVGNEFKNFLPLNKANQDLQNSLKYLQEMANCCGLVNGYEDWGGDVPTSCDCVNDKTAQCQMISQRTLYMQFMLTRGEESRMVYSQPCGSLILEYLDMAMNITLGMFFGFAALALLASLMSLGMIIRITAIPTPSSSVFVLNPNPPKYSELFEAA